MARQNDNKFAFPTWFKEVLWFLGLLAGVIVWHMTILADVKSRLSILETNYENLKESYTNDVVKILENTNKIIDKMDNK